MAQKKVRYPLLILVLVAVALLIVAAISRLQIDTDVAASLPDDDGVLADAVYIFKHHPIQNQIAIDIAVDQKNEPGRPDKDLLLNITNQVETELRASELFTRVGMDDMQQRIPALVGHVVNHLPVLFSSNELEDNIVPLMTPKAIEAKFKALQLSLAGFDSIGQVELITRDPLGFRDSKLAPLASLAPAQDVQIYKGKLLSADGRHAMILAQPSGSATDTTIARRLTQLLAKVDGRIQELYSGSDVFITLTPVGAYRAALDNETMVRKDVNKAILLATFGIAVLLLLAFPRPLIGLLALMPALAGTAAALFVFSLFNDSISIMALGFGGGVISITVDHGIAYLLFLDRPEGSSGKNASTEVWSVGLLAVLTTIGAFLVLSFSGFLIFKQLGLFTAMGIAFSFLFVHSVFPHIFPYLPPVRTQTRKPLLRWADGLGNLGAKGAWLAAIAGVALLFWAKPHFNVDLGSMNSVSQSTRSAEELFADVWGDIFSKIYLMTEAPTIEALSDNADRVLAALEQARTNGEIDAGFVSASIFPGSERRVANFRAWKAFWTPQRVTALRAAVSRSSVVYGFAENAFGPFFDQLTAPSDTIISATAIDAGYHNLMGISFSESDGVWRQITGITPGASYDGEAFYTEFSPLGKVFDARLFSDKMGGLLFNTFGRMLLIIGISVVVLLFVFFADWRLSLISLLPMLFAFACTLGVLGLMGRRLDIPVLMLAIIVLGLGIDYSLFFVRSYQRYQSGLHPNYSLIRMAVLMASLSTLIGFGVLCTAEHSLLQSAGLSSMLGIGFSMLGAFLILPPVLKRYFERRMPRISGAVDENAGILARYRNLEPYPRYFAKFKLKTDTLFRELPEILPPMQDVRTIVDIGTGYGVPSCWLLQRYPDARIFGIEPNPNCVRVANFALGSNGAVKQGLAPQIPDAPHGAEAAFMLDMCHFLDDEDFELTLSRLLKKLNEGRHLILRVVLAPSPPLPLTWRLDLLRMKIKGATPHHRPLSEVVDTLKKIGFAEISSRYSGTREDMAWIVAQKPKGA